MKYIAYTPKALCPRCARIKDYVTSGVTQLYCTPGKFLRAGCTIDNEDHIHVSCRDCGLEWIMHPKPAVPR